jgi:hypothetical protein
MKPLAVVLSLTAGLIAGTALTAIAYDVPVRGYTRSDGSYVAPYIRSAPDGNPYNNYSTQDNVNPYTGQRGTRSPYTINRDWR